MKKGLIYKKEVVAGTIWEDGQGIHFQYADAYIETPLHGAVSKTLPIRKQAFSSENMLPFFDGLIPEGWLLKIAVDNWKLNPRDRMNLLLTLCKDCIGDVSIIKEK